ncbi:MAG: Protein translocase subunit SecA [Candidatus Gottesmanbacteria bacterium GW2011_GWB1_43_11]|uniref:Protein translocase subunit SecA n=1 Tax=Candidatus Gottesmanbacteria bacterium GW2011_GWB1_43_11 TaxID=1618446 RepID=A0A0G1CPE1_9BACT|nr:MAG: Protein translocase subunit SecA [Candidatus Gottesmanbacteria bacterium GW2011_GWA2_42_16]KKS52551.1 MAG: Protein translocase subunit SecA [Candidatus Gottesmanbacteria bacterium GW2011_GWA1_42_26]KKS81861.1 MAG: Preprotein translocase subunit SecA, preprotein translocase subunit SecA [Candidatus Gottesmanbacteria bacterium GW2011_GWC1_43_10]KKS87332.1 MAG: Protein translocase subunit SecA [Candidatus Gottesmanbacteria bacterium GW2011_GWB1_43_11]OGG09063.1 MAG: preprotein translocase 
MFKFLARFLDSNAKQLSQIQPLVARINEQEADIKKIKLTDFRKRTQMLKTRLGEGKSLDDLLPEAFALAREAAHRAINERPYDVQLIAAIVLHQGKVAEQKTGEGKTLSASLPLYLNALTGRGVHLVTVNDYLARVGAGWIGPVYHLLGISVSAMIHDQSFIFDPEYEDKSAIDWRLRHLKPISRKEAYQADITYGINSEFGFDYLRDNMVSEISQCVQREYHYAIVDEVDSVLIDEARTPHIISAPDTEPTQKYYEIAKLVERLNPETDFIVDEKLRTAHLNEHGITKVEKMLGIPNLYEKDFQTVHLIEAALKARTLFKREKDYIVRDNQVVIVDEFTGRLLMGRRFSEGLHQAIEAKEGVTIQQESKTLATVSLQNYFRMYEKLAGMTGTAATEAEEFHKIYKLDVVAIPTHRPMVRKDNSDVVYKTARAKYGAIAQEVAEHYKRGQPVLVGTTSIDKNEIISDLLRRKGIPHQVLNAKNHEKEAMIISEAGEKGAVTVATNMAGRGVDIILGGVSPIKSDANYASVFKKWSMRHDEVVKLGGLHVIGTERHESRRIDNQLRGRAGRQGDPGSSRFFVSLEDDIMRLFGGDQVARLMTIFKLPEEVPLEHAMVSKAIEQAQIKVEGFHFDSRKHLVEYDDVLNKQREIVYKRRRSALGGSDLKDKILESLIHQIEQITMTYAGSRGEIEREKIIQEFVSIVPFDEPSQKQLVTQLQEMHTGLEVSEFLVNLVKDLYSQREKQFGEEIMRQVERWVTLTVIDNLWMDHLDAIDDLREGIGLRGYAQRDPLVEYKNEAFGMFESLIAQIDYDISHRIFRAQVQLGPQPTSTFTPTIRATAPSPTPKIDAGDLLGSLKQMARTASSPPTTGKTTGNLLSSLIKQDSRLVQMADRQVAGRGQSSLSAKSPKLGRNDPCWCGAMKSDGTPKKFKHCHYPQQPS